ncbi:hypothetical protein CLV63_14123 [Murinocardiopsis flavida]|uniref:Uncharacterized protein n=1 Tax=Murinocardiopsis flavida TaxID=645275 RepID=A0A2P8CDJ6_9ACTN|nr:hypothetical protein [Murinocardiopsis flavida]PSK83057.1 hypothetical protein CLV63_14123 [Murinocardiopsis flavida]
MKLRPRSNPSNPQPPEPTGLRAAATRQEQQHRRMRRARAAGYALEDAARLSTDTGSAALAAHFTAMASTIAALPLECFRFPTVKITHPNVPGISVDDSHHLTEAQATVLLRLRHGLTSDEARLVVEQARIRAKARRTA